MATQTDFAKAGTVLHDAQVEFIIVGGVAAILHGLGYSTYDLDVVYARDRTNIQRLVHCLEPYTPYLRGAPAGLPFVLDERTVRMGLNFTRPGFAWRGDRHWRVPGTLAPVQRGYRIRPTMPPS